MTMTARAGVTAALLLLASTLACARARVPGPTPDPAPEVDPSQVESVIFLVGDAGEARRGTYPILPRLQQDIEWWSERLERDSAVTVLFLGDIVYPLGMNPPGSEAYPGDSAVVMDQALLVAGPHARARGARGIFMAGNHDWGLEEEWEGFVRLVALRDFLEVASEHTGADVMLAPEAGAGGPYLLDVGSHLRLLILDTAWWLLHGESEDGLLHDGVLKGIEEWMLTAGDREVIIAAHHPFRSAGPHGGEFNFWRTFGVRYLLARSGAILQDLTSNPYRQLEEGLRDIFSRTGPPLAFGGHEHSLQILYATEPTDPTYNVVYGAASKMSAVGTENGIQFAASAPGYMRLVVEKDGEMGLFVEASAAEYHTCPDDERREACMATGIAAFRTVHSQRLR
jgi:Calcineurin-like phosphoesterase